MEGFVSNQTAHGRSAHRGRENSQMDQNRKQMTQHLKISRPNEANSAQYRKASDSNRQQILAEGRPKDAFDGSVLDDSTNASLSRIHVKDSQLESQGQPLHLPGPQYEQHAQHDGYANAEDQDSGTEEYTDDDGDVQEDAVEALDAVKDYIEGNELHGDADSVDYFAQLRPGESYPPTTSGHESNLDDQVNIREERGYEPQAAPVQPQSRSRSYGRPQQPQQKEVTLRSGYSGPLNVPTNTRQQSFPGRQANAAAYATPGYGPPPAGQTGSRGVTSRGTAQTVPNTRLAAKTAEAPGSEFQHPQAADRVNHDVTDASRGHSRILRSVATVVSPPAVSGTDFGPSSLAEVKVSSDDQAVLKKDFEVLHKESLDDELTKARDVLPKEDAMKPLQEQLQLARKLSEKEKHQFMASLTIDQWEEAGDWFLGQFGELVNKMKDARKDRRKMAQSFGDEILARHEQVAGKKRDIETALSAMGKSGASVLKSGTPKKARR